MTHWMAMPLYLVFWICDLIYVPQFKLEFLFYRLLTIPFSMALHRRATKINSIEDGETLSLLLVTFDSAIINIMLFRIGDPQSPYYAGLNLVAIGSLTFLPLRKKAFAIAASVIFIPYLLFLALNTHNASDLQHAVMNIFFSVGTVSIAIVIRHFNEKLRLANFNSMRELEREIQGRDEVIKTKTEEAVKLAYLSSQFSPQVVDSIRSGKIDLNNGIRRAQICSIFIDIVNSTERVVRVDKDKVHKVISMFMEDSIKILLKYDITVDKFLGDGILAFSNDPIKHVNFIDRVLSASIEIKERINENKEFYERNWYQPLQIRVGVALGFANVGFYGNEKYYKSYTAIGPVVNLASRLCSIADPNQILCSADVLDELGATEKYDFNFVGKRTLKGFGDDVIYVYELKSGTLHHQVRKTNDLDCPSCKTGMLYLEANDRGIYQFRCRSCGHVATDALGSTLSQAS